MQAYKILFLKRNLMSRQPGIPSCFRCFPEGRVGVIQWPGICEWTVHISVKRWLLGWQWEAREVVVQKLSGPQSYLRKLPQELREWFMPLDTQELMFVSWKTGSWRNAVISYSLLCDSILEVSRRMDSYIPFFLNVLPTERTLEVWYTE